MSGGTEGLRLRLRAQTREAHEALERDLGWEQRIATLPGYRSLLARFHGFHAAAEPEIGRALGDDALFEPRRRLALLAADLRHLGLSERAIEALPRHPPLGIEGPAGALGALYVLEGSTLGGRVIGRRVAELHGFRADGGCAYYTAHGERAGAMWRAFCDRLEAAPASSSAEVVAAANRTFEAMRLWLCAPQAAVAA